MAARSLLGKKLYPVPDIGFPFIYNHWYTVEFNLSEQFVNDQLKWFGDYGFDVFMIDAGGYKHICSWMPSDEKFKAGKFKKVIEIAVCMTSFFTFFYSFSFNSD